MKMSQHGATCTMVQSVSMLVIANVSHFKPSSDILGTLSIVNIYKYSLSLQQSAISYSLTQHGGTCAVVKKIYTADIRN